MKACKPGFVVVRIFIALTMADWLNNGSAQAGSSQFTSVQSATSIQSGTASYYADKYHGKPTASGEIFDMHQLTAAHPTLKFGTVVKVTNTVNGRSVTVRINDRGPFVGKRVIDLSLAAAQELQMVHSGLAPVTIEIASR